MSRYDNGIFFNVACETKKKLQIFKLTFFEIPKNKSRHTFI